jgi:hypothetical protein
MAFPATYNINLYKGDRYDFTIRPKTSAGLPYSISAATYDAYFYISEERGTLDTLTIVASAVVGTDSVTCAILPATSATMDATKTYYYDVSIVSKADATIVYTLLTGTITLTEQITPV